MKVRNSLKSLAKRHRDNRVVRRKGRVCLIGDGQVSMGSIVVKGNAKKVRRVGDDVPCGWQDDEASVVSQRGARCNREGSEHERDAQQTVHQKSPRTAR